MDRQEDKGVFGWAARRAERRPTFLAAALATYRRTHGVAEDQLAEILRCPIEALPTLALCRRPDPNKSGFRWDVERVASFVGADRVRLAQLLREVEVVETLRGAGESFGRVAAEAGLLAAARDARPDEAESSGRDEDDQDEQEDSQP